MSAPGTGASYTTKVGSAKKNTTSKSASPKRTQSEIKLTTKSTSSQKINSSTSDKLKKYEEFWLSKFKEQDFTALNLPYDYPLSNVKSYNGDKISFNLPKEIFENIEVIAKINNISVYSVFLATLYVLLYKYTMQNSIVVGSPFAGRSFSEVQELVRNVC